MSLARMHQTGFDFGGELVLLMLQLRGWAVTSALAFKPRSRRAGAMPASNHVLYELELDSCFRRFRCVIPIALTIAALAGAARISPAACQAGCGRNGSWVPC